MTATYTPIVGANMMNSIVNAAAAAVAKTTVAAGNGRNSRTRLILRLDDLDWTSTANDRTITIVCKAPPGIVVGTFGATNEDDYLPMMSVTAANAATQALVVTTAPFLSCTATSVSNNTITLAFVGLTGGDNLSFFIEADWSHSIT